MLLKVRNSSSGHGIEFAMALDPSTVLFSDAPQRFGIWTVASMEAVHFLEYDPHYGTANAGTVIEQDQGTLIASGHANGVLALWDYGSGSLVLKNAIDISSRSPIPSPYPLKNIRGVAHWRDGIVVTGSEDGDLSLLDTKTATELVRQRYNPRAKRGINGISALGDLLLVANCSVGPEDRNLWLFRISLSGFDLIDAINLLVDPAKVQSFNFDADLVYAGGVPRFFASTEEGILWAGSLSDGRLVVDAKAMVASDGGVLISVNPGASTVLAAALKIFLFDLPWAAWLKHTGDSSEAETDTLQG